ncbi:hypothetical protein P280DRAFT_457786 [Massarina eburnea CBS 473.64]|uniref:Nuclear pore complex protein Nup85 n=1 Tax=Massarina eburnea CBS 473.64 TaxID=1395130 RepID=A0A6A6RSQ2_9PLEO|nr:hypothetical protein P280DRAFT_457786 [Massarina eburnea CBS 473.64]
MFRAPENSSEPPSTPARQSTRSDINLPSTTPSGLPPPPDFSVPPLGTPAGAPTIRKDLFGSKPNFDPQQWNFSSLNSSPPRHGTFEGYGAGSYKASTSGRPGSQRGRMSVSGFRLPNSPPRVIEDEREDGDDKDMEEESDDDHLSALRRSRAQDPLSQSGASHASATESLTGPTIVRSHAEQKHYNLTGIAKGLAPSTDGGALHEPDATILETERLLEKLADSFANDAPEKKAGVLGDVAHELLGVWQTSLQSSRNLETARNGTSAALSTAVKLSDLLVNIHHPRPVASPPRFGASSLALTRIGADNFTPIPKVLLDWLNQYRSTAAEVDLVLKEPKGYSKHQYFWEAVHASAVRGHFDKTIHLLRGANFAVAYTAQIDELGISGYEGHHRRYAEEAVNAAVNLLDECPAVRADDWDVKGNDWSIFRKHVAQAFSHLEELSEGDSKNRHSISRPFQASHFGISQSQASYHLSVASRRAESKVPWSVYQNISKLYQLLLGDEEEIITISEDWIDATLCLAVWWDGDEEEIPQSSLAASRQKIARSQRIREVDVTPVKAYCQRIRSAFAAVLDVDEEFTVSTSDRFEVGVACIMDDNVEGALQILRASSLVIASAVAELATAGGWLGRGGGIESQFSSSDLIFLGGTGQHQTGISLDTLLDAYSELLAAKEQISGQDGKLIREGWELAIQVLGRKEDTATANTSIQKIVDSLPLQSAERVDKITQLCHNMGLSKEAHGIALKYADHLRANTQDYGDTLLYYARAHAASKIQEVLRVLVAHCLINSISYPPPAELDDSLKALVTSPKQTLTKLASMDTEAAQLLSNHLSGYATIRKYYDLRDEAVLLQGMERPVHRPMVRKLAAATSLMVIIASAASSIRGGLYDPEVETVVQIDVLLPLLGEALIFVNQPKRTLTLRHLYSLLSAIEDYTTAPGMIKTQCEEALQTTFSAANSTNSPSNSHHNLRQTTSNLSSQYSLIGSTDFSSAGGVSAENSAILIPNGNMSDANRGWDWRKGFPKGATGDDVVRVLRLGVARELARAFAEGEVKA